MIVSCLLFISIFISLIYASNSAGLSLLIASFFLCLTPIGETNIHIILILFSLLLCLYNKIFTIKPLRLLFLLVIIFINILPIYISFNGDLYKTAGKSLKIFVLLLPFTLVYSDRFTVQIKKIIHSIAILSIIFSFLWMTVRIYNGGFLFDERISGLVLDPNYSVIVICSIFLLSYTLRTPIKITNIFVLILIIILILTQSISSLVIFLLIITLILLRYPIDNNKLFCILTIFVVANIIGVIYLSTNLHLTMLSDWDTSYLSLKINSLIVRLYSQIEGMKMMINEPIHILYGFGSHTSVELFGKVMHNAYLQTLFDHGIILLISMYLFINQISKKYYFYLVVFYLQIMNFLFDNYFMGIVSLFFLLGLILERKSLTNESNKKNEKHFSSNVLI